MRVETFVLKFLSPETGCSAHEMRFEAEPAIIASILDTQAADLAAHSFHPDKAELLASFPRMAVDTKFYRRTV